MNVELIDQPVSALLCDRIQPLLVDPSTSEFYAASAWVRRPGIALFATQLKALAARLPKQAVRGLFGVDLGGTTVEGLESAIQVFGAVKVFYSPGMPRRTFHPKVYVAVQRDAAVVCIGSANLTFGGIGSNFETVAWITLNTSITDDAAFLASVRDWYERLWTDTNAAVSMTASRLQALRADPSVWLPHESEVRTVLAKSAKGSSRGSSATSMFSPVAGLMALPKLPGPPRSISALEDEQPLAIVEGIAVEDLVTPPVDDLRVVVAYIPHDRWKQVGFSKEITERFFRVFTNGELMWIEGIRQDGTMLPARTTKLVNPTTTNDNHRIELPEPDTRPDPKPERGVVVVLERSLRTFRYMHLLPGDPAYQAMVDEITARPKFGQHNSPHTKRVQLSYAQLVASWPGACPLTP